VREKEHLSNQELDWLVSRQPTGSDSQPPAGISESVRGHLATCKACRELLSMHEWAERELRSLAGTKQTEPGPDCPKRLELMELAAGLTIAERREELMDHVVSCDHCGPVFREALADFSGETNTEEEVLLSALNTSKPGFQEELGRELAAPAIVSRGPSKRARLGPLWAYGVAAAVLAVLVCSVILVRLRGASVDNLLARAYSEQRPFELRFRNAPYAPLRIERGAGRARFERPSALLKAEGLIAEKVKEAPNDAGWLQARGRSELLEGDYQAAIDSLGQAMGAKPSGASLPTDLGSAYYLRAEKEKHPSDYGSAIEQFTRALSQTPDDPVILFNRALAEERLFLYQQAFEDWEHYLRVDPTGGWANEARHHLEAIQNEVQEQKKKSGFFEPHVLKPIPKHSGGEMGLVKSVDEYLEAYFKVIETTWLPAIDSREKGTSKAVGATLETAQFVAKVARTKHDDPWLSDLLRTPLSEVLADGYRALAQSITAEDNGDYLSALQESRRAELMFQKAGNRAAELRAEVEEVTALRLTDANADCIGLARPLRVELTNKHYRWLESQVLVENAICFDLLGNEGTALALAMDARRVARDANYKTAYLRSLTVTAGLEATVGNTDASWKLEQEGLALYWSEGYPLMRLYSLLDGMELLAEGSQETHLQVTVLKESVATINADSDLMLRAVAHDQLAKCAMKADQPVLAETNFRDASQLFEMCPRNRVTFSRRADEEIWLAEAEIRLAKYDSASMRLRRVREHILSSPYRYSLDRYYQVLGALQTKLADVTGAEASFRAAVTLAEVGLQSLKSETQRIEWERDHSEAYRSLVDVRLRQKDVGGAFAIWEWFKGAPLRTFRKNSSIAGLRTASTILNQETFRSPSSDEVSDALKNMDAGSTLLTYAKLPSGYAVWLADGRGIQSRRIPGTLDEVDQVVMHFTKSCSNPASDPATLQVAGRAIYELLIAPIRDQLRVGQTLIFEGDETIATLPVQALVDRQGRYLGDIFDLVWSEGVYYEARLRPSSRISPDSRLLAVAVPEGEAVGGRDRLPDAVGEAASISRKFLAPRILIGSDATVDRVGRELTKATVFHFAGHAGLGPNGIGVILSRHDTTREGPTVLTVDELPVGRLNRLQLVVLSACSTEMGKRSGLADPESLVRGLLRAGVPHVVGTRWNLDSRSGVIFGQKFYDSLLGGKNPARALAEAAASVRASPETSHPYYWAGFNIFGRA
jgi:CHAT domain-containing protein/tetratricopeptide (TPR) repeat protein